MALIRIMRCNDVSSLALLTLCSQRITTLQLGPWSSGPRTEGSGQVRRQMRKIEPRLPPKACRIVIQQEQVSSFPPWFGLFAPHRHVIEHQMIRRTPPLLIEHGQTLPSRGLVQANLDSVTAGGRLLIQHNSITIYHDLADAPG